MRWRAINYFQHLEDKKSSSENENENSNCNSEPEFEPNFESYGFRSARKPKRVPELDKFEAALWKLVKNVTDEYTYVNNNFQNELISDLKCVKKAKKIIVSADKSNNQYMCPKSTYDKKAHNIEMSPQ